ncbi:MAG: putative addiction module antidote protein [Spirochaetaceae bacterium]|nr:putative addiction module antidote protein [Spirochaetaceae bacterium]
MGFIDRLNSYEKITFAPYDTADYIKAPEDVLAFLDAAMEENDSEFLLSAIGDIARSEGMAQLAGKSNVDRAGLYKSFSEGDNPSFITVINVLDNLGFRLKRERKACAVSRSITISACLFCFANPYNGKPYETGA